MHTSPRIMMVVIGLLLSFTQAGDNTPQRIRLYTSPDPSSLGGITGCVVDPQQAIEQVLAIPSDEPNLVYTGTIRGEKKNSFTFTGLPMRKYDLLIIYDNMFYDGLRLQRGKNTLTADDRNKIDASIQKSEPYFTTKIIHRLSGSTGQGSSARAICTYLRLEKSDAVFTKEEDGSYSRDDARRTFKLITLKQVGPGWQIVRARDLYPIWATKSSAKPRYIQQASLSGVRVTDYIKDLGNLDLR